jgi:hypothetical protein
LLIAFAAPVESRVEMDLDRLHGFIALAEAEVFVRDLLKLSSPTCLGAVKRVLACCAGYDEQTLGRAG